MPDLAALSAAMTSLQTAAKLGKAMMDLRDASAIQSKVLDLMGQIYSAQENALAAQSEQFDLLSSVRKLEQHIADLENWNTEKERYELKRYENGVFTYAVKPTVQSDEPPHELCANCYSQRIKSILHQEHWQPMRCVVLCCHRCGSVAYVKGNPHLEHAKLRPRPSH